MFGCSWKRYEWFHPNIGIGFILSCHLHMLDWSNPGDFFPLTQWKFPAKYCEVCTWTNHTCDLCFASHWSSTNFSLLHSIGSQIYLWWCSIQCSHCSSGTAVLCAFAHMLAYVKSDILYCLTLRKYRFSWLSRFCHFCVKSLWHSCLCGDNPRMKLPLLWLWFDFYLPLVLSFWW